LEWDGRALHLKQFDCLIDTDEIIQWADDAAGSDAVIGFGTRATQLSCSLTTLNFVHGDRLAPQSRGRHQIDVDPRTAAMELFLLGRLIRYRRGKLTERREGLRLLRGLMLDRFSQLVPRAAVTELPEIPNSSTDLRSMEVRLDSLLSAYVAAHWWYWGRERNDVLGDAAGGYIVVPHRYTAELKLADLRDELKSAELVESRAARWPMEQFRAWFSDAFRAALTEPHAMTLATVDSNGQPAARVVFLRDLNSDGFTFFTNFRSAKGRDLAANPNAALLFHWAEIGRQVRIQGAVERTGRAEAEAHFTVQPKDAQLGAWASWQSSGIADREFLDARLAKLQQKYAGEVAAPMSWGGYRLRPKVVEFWQSRSNHLHDRLRYSLRPDGDWSIERLAP
jgi:pyridoxamine 5'-phosphate oxidase